MRNFVLVLLVAGWMACGIGSAKAAMPQGVAGVTVTVTNNGQPASGVSFVLDLANAGKVAHSTGTTDSNGSPSNVLDLANLGKVRADVYTEVCQNGQHVLIVNSGTVPPDDGTCHNRTKIGGGYWLNGGDTVKIDVGTGTVNVEHGTSTGYSHYDNNGYKPFEFYGGFDYLLFRDEGDNFNFAGFDATALYNVNSHLGVGIGFGYKRLFGFDETESRKTYAGVIQESCRHGRYTPFAQAQIGGTTFAAFSESESGFYMKAGGGIKFNLNPTFSVVPVQAFWDYNRVEGINLNNFDLGAGISISFGSTQ